MLNRAIGEVAVASGAADELMRTILSFHTDPESAYILFEGQGTQTLLRSCFSLLTEIYMSYEVRYKPDGRSERTDLPSPDLKTTLETIRQFDDLQAKRNNVVHGTWSTASGHVDVVKPRFWSDKRIDVEDLYYCQVSKSHKMYYEQPMTIEDIRHLAHQMRVWTSKLAGAVAVMADDADKYLRPWMYEDPDDLS